MGLEELTERERIVVRKALEEFALPENNYHGGSAFEIRGAEQVIARDLAFRL